MEQLNNNDMEISEDNTARAADRVRALITMGAVHKQPEKEFEATCVTRGALKYLNSEYPGAFLANEGISYVSVGGDAIVGKEKQPQTTAVAEAVGEAVWVGVVVKVALGVDVGVGDCVLVSVAVGVAV